MEETNSQEEILNAEITTSPIIDSSEQSTSTQTSTPIELIALNTISTLTQSENSINELSILNSEPPQIDTSINGLTVLNTETPSNQAETSTPAELTVVDTASTSKRKRGRPKRSEIKLPEPREPRLNPDRAARHRKSDTIEFVDDEELIPSTSADSANNDRPQKKPSRKSRQRNRDEPPRPRGRPRKEIKKPICVVRPMPQSGSENRPKKCGWVACTHTANSARSLKTHVEREHLNNLTSFVCRWDGCTRSNSFKALYMLSLHLRSHIGLKPYECRTCGRTFTRQENLKTHNRNHNGERPFKCPICPKTFISASDKAKHVNRVHSEMKLYKCPVEACSKEYTDPSSLRKHIIKVHGHETYKQAKQNKQRNGPGNNYGVIANTNTNQSTSSLSNQLSTSRTIPT